MEENLPLVSIVTPSYNKAAFIEETILSVKDQTYPRIEHIVIDGGSTDGTLDILKKYSHSLKWISEPDKGQSDAINKGWQIATGEILAYLNSDDTYMPWAIETATQYFIENPDVGMVYGDCNIVDEHSNVLRSLPGTRFDFANLICGRCMIPQPAVFLRREVIRDIGFLDVNLHMAMDYDLWIRIGRKFKIEYIPKLLANFRICPGTKTVDELPNSGPEVSGIIRKLFSDPELPKQFRALERQAYSGVQVYIGLNYHSLRHMREARRHLIKAFILSPMTFLRRPWLSGCLITSFLGSKATDRIVKYKRKLEISFSSKQSSK